MDSPIFAWFPFLRAYAATSLIAHLSWEMLQLPLYGIWREGSRGQLVWAILHCTAGDVLIALSALMSALLIFGNRRWPEAGFVQVGLPAVGFGIGYTVYSEWLNMSLRAAWTYTEAMPILPPFGTGLVPLLQWAFIPSLALWLARRRALRTR